MQSDYLRGLFTTKKTMIIYKNKMKELKFITIPFSRNLHQGLIN